ncbi:T9SS type A sorting domain-containing protein [bacterium SCSIO 12741]|nr:T9SS type A sorting domain-containing protein [bacterium SCSIO 12741]
MGGWYKSGSYAFNLGVGFETIPHNLGKVWHPCFDNFVERATYDLSLKTTGGRLGVGSGVLTQVDTLGLDTLVYHWQLNQQIPTYLYGIAVANYTPILDTIQGVYGPMPKSLYALPGDVNRLKNAFVNLDSAYRSYEKAFGPYHWDRVGYSLTTQGAMEHATNICYPIFPGGQFPDETTMAHELSHHWWGNLVTCETDRDMWINEGMAVFSEYVFQEDLYGDEVMKADMASNLFMVVHDAPLEEDGYQPISGVPRIHTYGTHTYRKGSLVGYNLKTWLGDAVFYDAMTAFLDSFQFDHVNSYTLRDFLTSYTGKDHTSFFDRWVFEPGFPGFSVDTFYMEATAGLNRAHVRIRQRKGGSVEWYDEVPLTLTLWDSLWNASDHPIIVNGEVSNFAIDIPGWAVFAELNRDHELNYAMTSQEQVVKQPGGLNVTHINMAVSCGSVKDSAYVKVAAHWTSPFIDLKNAVDLGVRVNPRRYFAVTGWDKDATFNGAIFYRAKSNGVDQGLIQYHEDSLVLLYREFPGADWELYPHYNVLAGAPNDSNGTVQITQLQLGEYVLAERDSSINESLLSLGAYPFEEKPWMVYPNPAKDQIHFERISDQEARDVVLLDIRGKEKGHYLWNKGEKRLTVPTQTLDNGVYFYLIGNEETNDWSFGRIVIQK